MKLPVDPTTLESAIAIIRKGSGVDLSSYERSFLAKSLEKRRQATSAETPSAYLKLLSEGCMEAEALIRSLHVTYSEFFRNPLSFALLKELVLPSLAEKRVLDNLNEIRVWSAGCATGQEAWSVAILLDEMRASQEFPISFRIFATDVSEINLAIAQAGVYGSEAMGNVSWRHIRKYFSAHGDSFRVVAGIRERVDFSIYDLLDQETICPSASIYGHFDLVLCCNVLLYYNRESKRFILDKLRRCLVSGGYLIIGSTERQCVESVTGFRAVAPPAALFQKIGKIE